MWHAHYFITSSSIHLHPQPHHLAAQCDTLITLAFPILPFPQHHGSSTPPIPQTIPPTSSKMWHSMCYHFVVTFTPSPTPHPPIPTPHGKMCHNCQVPAYQLVWVCKWWAHLHQHLSSFHVQALNHLDLSIGEEKRHESIDFITSAQTHKNHIYPTHKTHMCWAF